ncbi:ATP-dependent RNA helicase DHX30 [Xylocopa sonorina]|uniref:ATP-dependent RNA helicase DHX30 n=1 Tax=Xylocopa sonorina TaxID=1818115 RepID=UPI00403A8EAD
MLRFQKTVIIKKVHKYPAADLNQIYSLINVEFNRPCISSVYTRIHESGNNKFECTITVTWPWEKSFSGVGSNKANAAHCASLACLNWLHEQNRLKGLEPLLYENTNDILKSQKIVSIGLTSELRDEIKMLINTFDDQIKSIITTPATIKDNEDDLKEDSEADDSLNSILSDSIETDKFWSKINVPQRKENAIDLPIIDYREEIVNSLKNCQVLVIKGETGCGKSTQVPQFIMEEYEKQGTHKCKIIVAEPRRISAVSLAQRVAWERAEELGVTVGYHVRFDSAIPYNKNSILYCTTGILLRKLDHQNTLNEATHIIIDEAHERSLQTDLLLTLFKKKLKENPHLKLIVMSASVNTELFQRYFSSAVIDIPGKLYPVKMHFMEDIPIFNWRQLECQNCLNEIPYNRIVKLIKWIIKNKPPGGILCFLPGWQEIRDLHGELENEMDNLFIVSLHSKIPIAEQQKAFSPPPYNMTKVILSTDIAETGITIKDISYVIDTAIKRDLEWNEDKSLSSLNFTRISKASITQRKGRAGRVKAGESYHLITKKEYEQLASYSKPEIFKIPLEEAVLISKTLTNEKTYDFFNSMIESPSSSSINFSVNNLQRLGILDDDENLTSLGKRVSHFPMQPKLSRALILACVFQCLHPVLSIVTQFSIQSNSSFSLDELSVEKRKFLKDQKVKYHNTSDHIALLKLFQSLTQEDKSLFNTCTNRSKIGFVKYVKQVYMLYIDSLISCGMFSSKLHFEYVNLYLHNYELIRAVLFAATNQLIKRNAFGYKNGRFTKNANKLITEDNQEVTIQKESVNYKRKVWPSEMLTYINKMEYVKRHSCIVSDTSMISPLTVLLFSQGDAYCTKMKQKRNSAKEDTVIRIKDMEHVNLCCEKEVADLLLQFRSIIWEIANYIIQYEGTDYEQNNLEFVKSYKDDIMLLLSKMLSESSKHIDHVTGNNNIIDDNKDTIEDEEIYIAICSSCTFGKMNENEILRE